MIFHTIEKKSINRDRWAPKMTVGHQFIVNEDKFDYTLSRLRKLLSA